MFLPPRICCLRLEGKADRRMSLGLGLSQINEIDIRQGRRLTEGGWTLHWIRAAVLVVTSLYHKMDHIGLGLEPLSCVSKRMGLGKKVITKVKIYLEKRNYYLELLGLAILVIHTWSLICFSCLFGN